MDFNEKTEVNATSLAVILGITARRVRQLAQDGVITTISRGKYVLSEAIQNYVEFRFRKQVESTVDKEKNGAELDIKKAKAIISILEAKELQGKMHRSEDVAAMTEDLIYTIRNVLLALPGRLAVDTATAESPAEAAEIIRKEVFSAMKELSRYQYDAKRYEERVRERRKWEADGFLNEAEES